MEQTRGLVRLRTAMDDSQIKAIAPSVYADHAYHGVSKRYAFIPTFDLLSALRGEGWLPIAAQQNIVRTPDKMEFARHLLRLRRDGQGELVDGVYPELSLVNSHGGNFSCFELSIALYVLVCSNGLTTAHQDGNHYTLKVRHTGRARDEIRSGAEQLAGSFPAVADTINRWTDIDLTPDERGVYARAASVIRWGEESEGNPMLNDAGRLLYPLRAEQREPTLWNTYQVTQEKVIAGGTRYISEHQDDTGRVTRKRARTRGITSITEDTRINRALWLLTSEMERLKRG